MAWITVNRLTHVWGPGRRCVLCRALWELLPTGGKAVEVPQEVADKAISDGSAEAASGPDGDA